MNGVLFPSAHDLVCSMVAAESIQYDLMHRHLTMVTCSTGRTRLALNPNKTELASIDSGKQCPLGMNRLPSFLRDSKILVAYPK